MRRGYSIMDPGSRDAGGRSRSIPGTGNASLRVRDLPFRINEGASTSRPATEHCRSAIRQIMCSGEESRAQPVLPRNPKRRRPDGLSPPRLAIEFDDSTSDSSDTAESIGTDSTDSCLFDEHNRCPITVAEASADLDFAKQVLAEARKDLADARKQLSMALKRRRKRRRQNHRRNERSRAVWLQTRTATYNNMHSDYDSHDAEMEGIDIDMRQPLPTTGCGRRGCDNHHATRRYQPPTKR